MATSSTYKPIALESLGMFDDDDEDEVMPLQPRSNNLGDALSTLNSLAKSGRPMPSSSHIQLKPLDHSKPSASARDWPASLDEELDLEEEMAREAAQEQEWGAAPDFPEQGEDEPEDEDDEEELEAMRAAEGQSAKATASSLSSSRMPVLEDNGLLGEAEGETQGSSSSNQRSRSPVSTFERADTASNVDDLYLPSSSTMNAPRQVARPNIGPTTSASTFSSSSSIPYDSAIPKYIPAGHFAALSLDGSSVRFERRRRIRGWKPPPPHYGESSSTGLLSRPVHQIIEAVRAREAEDIVAQDEELAARAAASHKTRTNARTATRDDGKVWVERYRPKRFAELLGDERVHREVMSWLKEWDSCVFKKKNRKRPRYDGGSAPAAGPSSFGAPVEWKDPYDRPQQRVLLISGAPGLGKTTLAHVLARAAGYGVYELNASDARSAGAVTDTIKMALESASLKDARPTCLVVDEIDGATGGGMSSGAGGEESRGFIKALVDLVEGGKGGRKAKGAKGSKGKKSKPLLRPIICICNDLYAPALRPLRPYCRLIRFQKPATNHLVTRLKSICEAEGISASSRCLSLLSALSQGDIRSCLNVLQLAKLRSLRKLAGSGRSEGLVEVTEAEIREAGVGVKDGSTNLQTVWSALFKTPSPKERARKTAPYEGPALTQHLISLVQSSGDYNRLLQGCFEHYPNLSFVDDGWWRIRSMLDWVAWGNELQDKAWSNGTFDLMGYVPWSFVKWNGLFANTVNSLPEWPKVDYEQFLKKQAFEEISVELHHSLPPSLRVQFGRDAVVRELGPTLMRMLTPDLKPINNQIVRPAERATMGSLVNIMLHLSLNFAQERTDEGVLTYRLEPPLEVFTSYDGKKSAAVNVGRYAVRAIVMRELEAERARRRNGIVDGTPGEASSSSAKNALEAYRKADANGLGLMGKKDKVALDFFGRPVVLKPKKEAGGASAGSSSGLKDLPAPILAARQAKEALTAGGTTSSTNALPKEDPSAAEEAEGGAGSDGHRGQKRLKVHYRHNEGYSNAVRQPIKMSALL